MAVKSQKHSYATLSLNMRLPSISEAPVTSPTLSSSSPRSSKTSRTRDNENPFRKNSRSSITSSSSSVSDSSVTSQSTSVMPKLRRASFNRNKRCSAIDLTTSEEIMRQVEQRRRNSVLNVMPDGRKASFRTIGARVTTLLKAKNAFAMLRKNRAMIEDDTAENEKEFEIEEMPPAPRFASTLSAEAQYAMMKGYEDVMYTTLCRQYPEYRSMLRRNMTPLSGVTVKCVKDKYSKTFEKTKIGEEMRKSNVGVNDMAVDMIDSCDATGPVSASTPTPEDGSVTSSRQILITSPVPALDLVDQSPLMAQNISPISRSPTSTKITTTKTKHFPEVQSKERQLVLTYRYQRAMDILDSLREHQGLLSLSPRKKENRIIEPLKDYNSWSHVWTHEFEAKRAMKNI